MANQTGRISTRIDQNLKLEVAGILAAIGLTESEAIKLFYSQIKSYKGIPFPVKVPNEQTLKAFEESKNPSKLSTYKDFDDLLEDL